MKETQHGMAFSQIKSGIKLFLLGLNFIPIFFVVFLISKYIFYEALFFNRDLTRDQVLNNTQAGFEAFPETIASIVLDYLPSDRARSLVMLLDCSDIEGDYEMLRVSSTPDIHSGIFQVRQGKIVNQTIWNAPLIERNKIKLETDDSSMSISVNEQTVYRQLERMKSHTVDFLFQPVPIINFFPHRAIENITIVTADPAKHVQKTVTSLPRWIQSVGIAITSLGSVLVLLLVYFRLFRIRRKRGWALIAFRFIFSGWILLPLLLLVLFFLYRGTRNAQCPYGEFFADHQFDTIAFTANPMLYDQPYNPNSDAIKILAFGESTTVGEPYFKGTYDWPTRLQQRFHREKPFGDTKVEVYNLGYSGAHLETLIPLGSAPFFKAAKPQIVILHTVINSYLDVTEMNFFTVQVFGVKGMEPAFRYNQKGLDRYRSHLEETLKAIVSSGALPVLIVPEIDTSNFNGNPLAPLQAIVIELAQKYRALVVRQKDANEKAGEQILFHEFVHLNKIGYRLLADAVFDELLRNIDRVPRPNFTRPDAN